MTTGFDLDEIERLLAAATVGDWWNEGCGIFYAPNGWLRTLIYDEGGHTEDDAALIVTLKRSAPAMIAAIRELRAENARLKSEVVAFCGPWAAQYARETGLEPGHLHPTHYDILEKAGARMANFTRAALGEPQ